MVRKALAATAVIAILCMSATWHATAPVSVACAAADRADQRVADECGAGRVDNAAVSPASLTKTTAWSSAVIHFHAAFATPFSIGVAPTLFATLTKPSRWTVHYPHVYVPLRI